MYELIAKSKSKTKEDPILCFGTIASFHGFKEMFSDHSARSEWKSEWKSVYSSFVLVYLFINKENIILLAISADDF